MLVGIPNGVVRGLVHEAAIFRRDIVRHSGYVNCVFRLRPVQRSDGPDFCGGTRHPGHSACNEPTVNGFAGASVNIAIHALSFERPGTVGASDDFRRLYDIFIKCCVFDVSVV